MLNRLYLQIYLAFVGGLIIFAILAGGAWKLLSNTANETRFTAGLGVLLSTSFAHNDSKNKTKKTLQSLAKAFHVELSLYQANETHIASSHQLLPLPQDPLQHGWNRGSGGQGTFSFLLDDGRKLVVFHHKPPFARGIFFIGLLMIGLALIAYPLSKRLTCRLEQLQKQVDAFGAGDLSARATVKGKDEIATLAKRFNVTAKRVEQLIKAQKHILAGASHELRTPLTRMRMTVELLTAQNIEKSKRKLTKNIAELDVLVDELLLASKLETEHTPVQFVPIDMLALAAEEASHYDAIVSGEPAMINGHELMLRRALRNLLDNAERYKKALPTKILVTVHQSSLTIQVCDDGDGIKAEDIEHIFEPFFQTRDKNGKHGSLGLGLSLVQKIAKLHHGNISYISPKHSGACFEMTLPVAND